MERFDFTDYNNIRALVDASARAVNDQYADLRKAREAHREGTGTRAFTLRMTQQHDEAMVLNYKLQAESCLLRADNEERSAMTPVHHARVNELRACAATYLARADECYAEAVDSKAAWLGCTD